jgi:hypothetical protein
MDSYIFRDGEVNKGYQSIFLCGVKYKSNSNDKRYRLKEKLVSMDGKNKPIILEENFTFASKSNRFLSYDDIFMKNLKDIENLTALFSDKVIIIHESISTAAELGMFAMNELIAKKICILIPDEYAVEENKITSFLQLAFFRTNNNIEIIKFYPEVDVWKISENKMDFRTKFFNNEIIGNLEKRLETFLKKDCEEFININFKKVKYKNHIKNDSTVISYFLDEDRVDISVSVDVIRAHIISFFNLESFKREMRIIKTLSEHITYIEQLYKKILMNTIEELEGRYLGRVSIGCKECQLEFRQIIAYTLYLLQAMEMVQITKEYIDDKVNCKTSIKLKFENIYKNYVSLIECKPNVVFGV